MRNFVAAAILSLGLTSCAASTSNPPEHGNFVLQSAPAGLAETIVADTMKQLIALYPPANTRFDLGQPTADLYGAKLVQSLRQSGYALSESASPSPTQGLSLRYVVDSPEEHFYRVTLRLGTQSLSRAYEAQNEIISPAGAWVRKE